MPSGTPPDLDLYAELEVASHASAETIGAAYRSLARRHHPDTGHHSSSSDERMRRLNVAFEWLGDASSRRLYDASRRQAPQSPPRAPKRKVPPPQPPPRLEYPSAGRIWFGKSVDLETLALSGRTGTFPPNHTVALLAHLSRPSRGETVYFALDFGFPATWPGGMLAAGSTLCAHVLPAAEMSIARGKVTVCVMDMGGNALATGTLTVDSNE